MKKDGLMAKLGRKAAPYLLASTIPLFACSGNPRSIMPSEPVQEEYSPQEQKEAEQAQIWYESASQDNIISPEELNDLETRIEYKQNDSGKQKAVSLTSLASEEIPDCDLDQNGKTDIFDLLYLLRILSGSTPDPEKKADLNKDGKTDIFDLLTQLQVLSGTYGTVAISGRLLDTDSWEPNTNLRGWVECLGDTTWTDSNGRYSKRIKPRDLIAITAGYKAQNNEPASFVTTVNNINANANQNLDIAVCTYLNLGDVSPEGFREGLRQSNFEANSWYNGAKGLRKDMVWYLQKKGRTLNPDDKWAREFTDEQWVKLQEIINEVNTNLKHPLPVVLDTTGWYSKTNEERTGKIIIQRRLDSGAASIGHSDYNSDGRKDFVAISLLDPANNDWGPASVYEETNTALTAVGFTETTLLASYDDPFIKGKMMIYEGSNLRKPSTADLKNQRFWEAITYELGQLYPKMPIDEVLKLQ